MANSFMYDVAMALIPGTAAGYYSGLLMSKQAKFNSLKHEALRCIRVINFVGDEQRSELSNTERVNDLHLIASEYFHLKHQRAGEGMLIIAREAGATLASSKLTAISVESFMAQAEQWQKQIRALRPGPRFLLPWGQI